MSPLCHFPPHPPLLFTLPSSHIHIQTTSYHTPASPTPLSTQAPHLCAYFHIHSLSEPGQQNAGQRSGLACMATSIVDTSHGHPEANGFVLCSEGGVAHILFLSLSASPLTQCSFTLESSRYFQSPIIPLFPLKVTCFSIPVFFLRTQGAALKAQKNRSHTMDLSFFCWGDSSFFLFP